MNNAGRLSFMSILAVLVFLSGCASKGQTNRQVNSLQAQVGVLTDELIRLDEQLQTTRSGFQGGAPMPASMPDGGYTGGDEGTAVDSVYRTPSGFEIPARSIQEALKNAGYYNGNVDGKIGPNTRKAVRAFQKDNGLDADGVVGRGTWKRLQSYSAVVKP